MRKFFHSALFTVKENYAVKNQHEVYKVTGVERKWGELKFFFIKV